ncbi:MAG TPA: ubiquitin-conjugating enzyme E2 [Solirubrobacterales bacterium]|nr:ubiquitin-conjugating enzyme E2 [Solirubrobacterales bacterium]
MNPRERRLVADLYQMKEISEQDQLSFEATGDPPEAYEVAIKAPGLALDGRRVVERDEHRFEVYLHRDYPRRPPVITWQTPVYHPNLLGPDRNGGVCIGAWRASESLADLVTRLVDLVSYRSFSLDDALDTDAASWIRRFALEPGFDIREVLGVDVKEPDDLIKVEVKH